jgi:hypothetical protein
MLQTRDSGVEADKFGRANAIKVANFLGTSLISKNSNEIELEGELYVIKSTRRGNNSIGITKTMLKRLNGVVGAFENEKGEYELYKTKLEDFLALQNPSRSLSHQTNKGSKVIKMSSKDIEKHGSFVGIIK